MSDPANANSLTSQSGLTAQQLPARTSSFMQRQPSFVGSVASAVDTDGRPIVSFESKLRAKTAASVSSQSADPSSPFFVPVPVNGRPTDVLSNRFASWRRVIRSLVVYLGDVAQAHDQQAAIHAKLTQSVNFPFFDNGVAGPLAGLLGDRDVVDPHEMFTRKYASPTAKPDLIVQSFFQPLGSGAVQDIPATLLEYHRALTAKSAKTAKELSGTIVPRMARLEADLGEKIREIRSLESDFKSSLGTDVAKTSQLVALYKDSIAVLLNNPNSLDPKNDPFLLKLQLDNHLKKQVHEENFLLEAYQNLQSSGLELEKIVVKEIKDVLVVYTNLLTDELLATKDVLIDTLVAGLISKDLTVEWEPFILRDRNFVPDLVPPRDVAQIVYPLQHSPAAMELKSGYLQRKSKFLRTYSEAYYVLTPGFLHEFKSNDRRRDPYPVMSFLLDDCQPLKHSRSGAESSNKFVIMGRQRSPSSQRVSSKSQNWVFMAPNYEEMISWYSELKKLTSLPSSQARVEYAASKLPKEEQDLYELETSRGARSGKTSGRLSSLTSTPSLRGSYPSPRQTSNGTLKRGTGPATGNTITSVFPSGPSPLAADPLDDKVLLGVPVIKEEPPDEEQREERGAELRS